MAGRSNQPSGLLAGAPFDRLKQEAGNLLGALGGRAMSSLQDKVGGLTERLTDYVENGGSSSLSAALTGAKDLAEGKSPARSMLGAGMSAVKSTVGNALGGSGDGDRKGRRDLKVTNIVESIDVGVPARLAYDQWTQFTDFPSFMKKVENVEQESDEKLTWKAQVFWSHRTWESTILKQAPDEEIVWRSKGDKGHVDGAVTFHEIAPRLTRVLVVLEYHPQGFFEKTGNIWRAQGRRVRLELKHYRRHVMSQAILQPDEVEGWRGVIEDGEVVKDHETALAEERQGQEPAGDEDEEEYAQDSYSEEEYGGEGGARGDYPDDEYEDEGEPEEGYPEDEYEEEGEPGGERADDRYEREGAPRRRGSGSNDGERRRTARPRAREGASR